MPSQGRVASIRILSACPQAVTRRMRSKTCSAARKSNGHLAGLGCRHSQRLQRHPPFRGAYRGAPDDRKISVGKSRRSLRAHAQRPRAIPRCAHHVKPASRSPLSRFLFCFSIFLLQFELHGYREVHWRGLAVQGGRLILPLRYSFLCRLMQQRRPGNYFRR